MKNPKVRIVVYLILGYVCFAAIMFGMQRSFIYFPDTSVPDPQNYGQAGSHYKVIQTRTNDGLTLKGWYHAPQDETKPVLLWFHGNAQNHASRAYWTLDYIAKGYGVVLAGYRGYAGNPGSPSEQGFYSDAKAWVDKLLQDFNISKERIIVYGESLGSGVAVEMASRYDLGALILHAPYSSVIDIAFYRFPILPTSLLLKDHFNSFQKIRNVREPVLIIHGRLDKVIPIHYGRKLFKQANEPKTFIEIPEAGHNNLYNYAVSQTVIDFLEEKKVNFSND
jgi:hypothetical protein